MAHGVFECDAVLDVIEWKDEYDDVLTDCAEFDKFEEMGILDHNDYDFDISPFTPVHVVFEPYDRAALHCLISIYVDEPTKPSEIEKKYGVEVISYCPLDDYDKRESL